MSVLAGDALRTSIYRRSSDNRGCRSGAGFTLIELLVVIGIIALLAAILFPVFAQVRSSAHRTTCLSNMRQIGMAFQMYLQDTDDTFPWLVSEGTSSTLTGDGVTLSTVSAGPPNLQGVRGLFMEYTLWPYLGGSHPVMTCPTNRHFENNGSWRGIHADGRPNWPLNSYAYMYCGIGAKPSQVMLTPESWVRYAPLLGLPSRHTSGNPQDYCLAGQPVATLRDPANVVSVFCNSYASHQGYRTADVLPVPFGGNGKNLPVASLLLYADGHVKFKVARINEFLASVLEPLR